MLRKLLVSLLLMACQSGCENVKSVDLQGLYLFRSDELQETLLLKPDGTFEQKLQIGSDKFDAHGSWIVEAPNIVKLRHFLVRFDTSTGGVIDPPLKYEFYGGYWLSHDKRIAFDEEDRYYLSKVNTN